MLPLPQTSTNHSSLGGVSQGGPQTTQSATTGAYGNHSFDSTGQLAPPGMKPRVAATLWEDEGSLCFQVEARGVCVARREGENDSPPILSDCRFFLIFFWSPPANSA
jgi:protein SOK2